MTHEFCRHRHSSESPPARQRPVRLVIAAAFRGIRDDVCAWCFLLAPPNKGTWDVQLYSDDGDDRYLTFCSRDCRRRWCEEFDEECEEAYLGAASYVRDVFAWPVDFDSEETALQEDVPPSEEEVEKAWKVAHDQGMKIVSSRLEETTIDSAALPAPTPAYATLLFFLLDATIFAMRFPLSWKALVAELGESAGYAYATRSSLASSVAAYVQLVELLPINILHSGALSRETIEHSLLLYEERADSLWGFLPPKKGRKRRSELLGFGIWAPLVGQEASHATDFDDCLRGCEAFCSYLAAWGAGHY